MNIIKKVQTYADIDEIKERFISAANELKKYADKGIAKAKKISDLDMVIYIAVAASFGALLSAVFSKTFKKLIALFAIICSFGTLYLLYKKFFDD